ncbi:MAG: hypothetical protein E6G01_18705 [Actinobacteria bacterium]|nr:MAG: hypothetical protein E6G01_18705 [Actinomycetota bacterium]
MPSDRWIEAGTEVEVRNRFTGDWSVGFEVISRSDGVVRVRRLRDGAILPTAFRDDEVRVCASAADSA